MGLSSCSISERFTGKDPVLAKNTIKIDGRGIDKTILETELDLLILQKPNTNWSGIPREWIYFATLTDSTSSRFRRYINTKIGQPPSIYNEETSVNTAHVMEKYLRNKKGYFDGKVGYDTKTEGKEVEVTYEVDLGKRSRIASVEYLSDDKALLAHVQKINATDRRLKKGDPIDEQLFNLEKNRLTLALQNRGYATFATNYIVTYGDSTKSDKELDIFFKIQPPQKDSVHTRYTIGDIRVFPDYIQNKENPSFSIDTFEGIYYHRMLKERLIDPMVVNHSNYIQSGSSYSRDDRKDTYRKLTNLGVYKFINITTTENSADSSILDVKMYLTPYKNRWTADFGADLFYAVLNQQKRRILGFSFNSQLQNRNVFGGAEQLTINASLGTELQLSPLSLRSQSYGLNSVLKIPRFIDLSVYGRGLNRLSRFFNKRRSFYDEATTSIGATFNHVNLLNYYSISNIGASYAYNYQPEPQTKLVVRQTGIEYNRYAVQDSFKVIIDENPLLEQSFQNTLMTGFLLKDVSLFLRRGSDEDRYSHALITNLDFSGLEVYGLNALYNGISGNNKVWQFNDNLGFAKYAKVDVDYRFYTRFNKRHSIASRLFAGVAVPFGSLKSVPFIKQYSAGGPNSLRAWNQKELGPGSYDSRPTYEEGNKPYYQQGDIRLEANIEYRFDAFWLVEGALFMDAGNVWTLYPSETYTGGRFSSRFYDDVAFALGYGFRFDFTYFNIRFDFGYKIREPYQKVGQRWASWSRIGEQGLGNFQVAVNYPF